MNLPGSQQRILNEVEARLRAEEPRLELAFAAFARVTRAGKIPAAEQLGSWGQRLRAARLLRRIARWPAMARVAGLIVVGLLIGVVIGLPVISIQHQARCWGRPSVGAAIAGRCQQPGSGRRPVRPASPGHRPASPAYRPASPGHQFAPSFPRRQQLP